MRIPMVYTMMYLVNIYRSQVYRRDEISSECAAAMLKSSIINI
jgi:hypothetical protein